MSRSATRTSAVALLISSTFAHAQPPAEPSRPYPVAVDDLPPLPEALDEAPAGAAMLAASEAQEDVVVGAAKREQSLGNVASAVTVISGDRLRRFGYRTIGEAVAAVAGVYLVDNRLSYSVGIRGLQIPGDFNTRILVLVDGASVNEAWGAFAGVGFDGMVGIDEVSRVEVIRGPVSSVYGTNAFFGIINIVTRGASDSPRVWGRTSINSINGVLSGAGFAAGGLDKQIRGSVFFQHRIGEDTLVLPDGGDTNFAADGSRSYGVGLVGAYDGSFGQIRASRFNRESPFAPYDVFTGLGGTPYDQVDHHFLVEGGHTRAITKRTTLGGRVYSNLYRFSDVSPPADPVLENPLETTGAAQTYGGEVRGRYEIVVPERLGITVGSELSYNRTRSTAFESTTPDELIANTPKRFTLGGIYTELDGQPAPWFGFTGGLRADIHSQLQDNVSPRAALFFSKPERYGVKLLYAEGFRNPSAFEAFFEDGSDFIADPTKLQAESIRSFEAVAWMKSAGLATRLSAFYWDAADIIEAQASPSDPDLQQHQNTTRYVSRGVEAEASYRNSRGWYGFAGGALAQVGTEGAMGGLVFGDVTNAPLITAGAGVSTPKLGGIAHVSLEGIFLGPRPTRLDIDGNPSPDSPAWLGLNLTIYAPKVAGFDMSLGARNLIGTRDQMPAPPDYDRSDPATVIPRVPGEGREIYVKVGYSY
jgi:outer membrane receptor for ferrienterochelin and colicins